MTRVRSFARCPRRAFTRGHWGMWSRGQDRSGCDPGRKRLNGIHERDDKETAGHQSNWRQMMRRVIRELVWSVAGVIATGVMVPATARAQDATSCSVINQDACQKAQDLYSYILPQFG